MQFLQNNANWALLACLVIILASIPFIPLVLAKFKLGFTTLPQGQILVVMKGDTRSHYLARLGKWLVNKEGLVLRDDHPHAESQVAKFLHEKLGVYWFGLPPFRRLHEYKFTWGKWVEGSDQIKPYNEIVVPTVYFRFPYGHQFKGLETSAKTEGNLSSGRSGLTFPVKIDMLIEVQVVDLDLCIFPEAAWLKKLLGIIQEILKGEVGNSTWEELIEQRDAKTGGSIAKTIMKILCGEKEEIQPGDIEIVKAVERDDPATLTNERILNLPSVREIGVMVRKIDILNIEIDLPAEEAKKVMETINKAAVATRQAKASVIEAEGKAKSTTLVGDAEAGVIKAKGLAEAEAVTAKRNAFGEDDVLKRAHAFERALTGTSIRVLTLGAGQTPILLNETDGEEGEKPETQEQKPKPYQWGKTKKGGQP